MTSLIEFIDIKYLIIILSSSLLPHLLICSGNVVMSAKSAGKMDENSSGEGGREMVTKLQRKSLVKEGYKIIGTHSAVKICRWTKNQMRGRGGCYKHSFYGIVSYQV